jgi:hypothetical protein
MAGRNFMALLCTRERQDEEWRQIIQATGRLDLLSARRGFALLHLIRRLRPVSREIAEQLNTMALEFNIADDPILRPATDMVAAKAFLQVATAFGLDVSDEDAEALSHIGAQLGELSRAENKEALIAALLPRRANRR